jgi:hypothetical protein
VLDEQLAGTTMAATVQRASEAVETAAGALRGVDGPGARGAGPPTSSAAMPPVPLTPVDLDFNLVAGLLASVGAAGGAPGPAGSLAGLLGIALPPGVGAEVVAPPQSQQP